MSSLFCPIVPSLTQSPSVSKHRHSSTRRPLSFKRAMNRISCAGAFNTTASSTNTHHAQKALARPSVYSLASLRQWNRMSAISRSETVSAPRRYALHVPESPRSQFMYSGLDFNPSAAIIPSMQVNYTASLSRPVPYVGINSAMVPPCHSPILSANLHVDSTTDDPSRESWDSYLTRAFSSDVSTHSFDSQRPKDSSSHTIDTAQSSESSMTLLPVDDWPKLEARIVRQASAAQLGKPKLVTLPSCRRKPLPPLPPPSPSSCNLILGPHPRRSGHGDLSSLQPPPHNSLPYQTYSDPFQTFLSSLEPTQVARRAILRKASLAGLDLHLPEADDPAPRISPMPDVTVKYASAPELGTLTLTHNTLPYQTYSEPIRNLFPVDSESIKSTQARHSVLRQASLAGLDLHLSPPSNGQTNTKHNNCSTKDNVETTDPSECILQDHGAWLNLTQSEKDATTESALSCNDSPDKTIFLHPSLQTKRIVIKRSGHRSSHKIAIRAYSNVRRPLRYTFRLPSRQITNATASVPRRFIMVDSYPTFVRTGSAAAILPRLITTKSIPKRAQTVAKICTRTGQSCGQARCFEVSTGTVTRALTNARSGVPLRVVMIDGYPVFPVRTKAVVARHRRLAQDSTKVTGKKSGKDIVACTESHGIRDSADKVAASAEFTTESLALQETHNMTVAPMTAAATLDPSAAKERAVIPGSTFEDSQERTIRRIRDSLVLLESSVGHSIEDEVSSARQRRLFAEIEGLCGSLGV